MIIQHNLSANFTGRQLNINNKSKISALEKLSTGYRINRAADDAAGLAISEEMRAQIRGLNQGARNVTDGISMVNTAEGGIGEQISILQRIRVLTVQSYNDTNTQDDRFAIQMEVDELLKEIDQIATDTEFNTIKVLQGDKKIVTKEIVEPSEKYSMKTYYVDSQSTFPAWATHDAKLTVNNPNVSANNKQQCTATEYVVFNQGSANPEAYGPKSEYNPATDGDYKGEWSETLADNYSATVDFSAIAGLTSKEDLFQYIGDLIGTGIGYECYTCDRIQGVYFESGDIIVEEIYNEDRSKDRGNPDFKGVSLQTCIEEVGKLMEEAEFNVSSEQVLWGSYSAYVNNTAKKIAEEIVDKIVEKTFNKHFVRTKEDADNPYRVIFYDYRDDGVTQASALPGKVLEDVTVRLKAQVQVENQPVELEHVEEEGYWIQAGANSFQGVLIDFPDTRLGAIDMKDYTVFPDGYCSITPDKKYDPTLLIGAEKIGNGKYHNGNVGGREETTTHQVTKQVSITETKFGTDGNGELKPYIVIKGTKMVTYTYTETKMVGGVSKEFYAYEPDILLRVDRAIASLSKSRSYLGAVSNRLDHAYLNDLNTAENLQSAESRIRDEDMAAGMVSLARDNILEQAGVSMLAQANRMSEGILQLLR